MIARTPALTECEQKRSPCQSASIEHFGPMLCSCFFSYSYSKRSSIAIRLIDPQVTANRFDQPSASPQSIQPSITSTVSLSTSTSTTKSDAMHEQPRSPMSRQVKVTVRKRPIRDVGASLGSPFRELYPIDTPTGPETLGTACVLEKSIASGLK